MPPRQIWRASTARAKETLLATIRHSGIRRPARRRVRRMLQPDSQRLRYFAALRGGLLQNLRHLIQDRLVPALPRFLAHASALRQDADEFDDLHDALDALAEDLAREWTSKRFAQVVQPIAQDVARFSGAQLHAVLRDQLGVDVLASEPWLEAEAQKWVAQNVALIKTIPPQFFSDIERRLVEGVHSGERWEDLAKMLEERTGVAESRANLIARDQVGKLMGNLNQRRMEDLGVTGYTWRTMHDNRVRDEHEERDGEHFEWSDPPEDGHPGEPIQCRCFAEPDLGPIFEEAWE